MEDRGYSHVEKGKHPRADEGNLDDVFDVQCSRVATVVDVEEASPVGADEDDAVRTAGH